MPDPMPTRKDVFPSAGGKQPRAEHLHGLGDQGNVNRLAVFRIGRWDRPDRSGQISVGEPHSEEGGFPRPGQQRQPEVVGDPHVLRCVNRIEQPREFLRREEPFPLLLLESLHPPHGIPANEIEIVARHLEQPVEDPAPAVRREGSILLPEPSVNLEHLEFREGRYRAILPRRRGVGVKDPLLFLPRPGAGFPMVLECVVEHLAERRVRAVRLPALSPLGGNVRPLRHLAVHLLGEPASSLGSEFGVSPEAKPLRTTGRPTVQVEGPRTSGNPDRKPFHVRVVNHDPLGSGRRRDRINRPLRELQLVAARHRESLGAMPGLCAGSIPVAFHQSPSINEYRRFRRENQR